MESLTIISSVLMIWFLSQSSQQEAMKQKEELKKEVSCLRSELQQIRDSRDNLSVQVQRLTSEFDNYTELTTKSIKNLDKITIKTIALEETCASQREKIQLLQHQLAASNEKLKRADLITIKTMTEYEKQKNTIIDLQDRLAEAELQIIEAEKLRKKLHNTILELTGNIQVFYRVRLLLLDTDSGGTDDVVSYPTSLEYLGRGIDLTHNAQKYSFTFDKVFNEASQEDVFVEISQLVQSALGGYKVCIFAYGQTGSSKTYTMMGNTEHAEQKGHIPRSLEQIFQTSQSLQCQGWKYKMQVSLILTFSLEASGGLSKQYRIKHDTCGNTIVFDLTIIDVCSIKAVSFLLQQASQSR
uniref:Kinesin motor domain-containing protein n=2 Tax=Musa acuminata subsp. malaccensis TaxID=214687 RepID=A0A804JIC1_MUSAM